jgi:hypothetical protein
MLGAECGQPQTRVELSMGGYAVFRPKGNIISDFQSGDEFEQDGFKIKVLPFYELLV